LFSNIELLTGIAVGRCCVQQKLGQFRHYGTVSPFDDTGEPGFVGDRDRDIPFIFAYGPPSSRTVLGTLSACRFRRSFKQRSEHSDRHHGIGNVNSDNVAQTSSHPTVSMGTMLATTEAVLK